MVADVLWKLFRKSLPGKAYEKLRESKLLRPCGYHSFRTYQDIAAHYRQQHLECAGKTVLEFGPGFQFYTAFFFLLDGASTVLLVDPVFENKDTEATLKKQFIEFSKHHTLDENSTSRIGAFASIHAMPGDYDGRIDCVYSHFVLEHLEDLESFFDKAHALLRSGGYCYSFVDLSDHSYHIFDSRKITRWIFRSRMLYHLRYSDEFYRLLSDRRTWQNRRLFPAYSTLAAAKGFRIVSYALHKCKKAKIHRDILKRVPQSAEDDRYVSHFSLLLQKQQGAS